MTTLNNDIYFEILKQSDINEVKNMCNSNSQIIYQSEKDILLYSMITVMIKRMITVMIIYGE